MRNTNRSGDLEARRDAVERLVAQIGAAFRELRCAGSQRLVKLGVSMTHLHVLVTLRHHGPMAMSRLADVLDVSMSNATGLIDRLEERGYIERVRVPDDRRLVLVRLLPEGDRVLDEFDIVKGDLVRAILARLDEAQLRRVELAFGDVAAALEAEMASAPERYVHHHEHAPRPPSPLPATG